MTVQAQIEETIGLFSGAVSARAVASSLSDLVKSHSEEIGFAEADRIFTFTHGLFARGALSTAETADLMTGMARNLKAGVREDIVKIHVLDWACIGASTVKANEEGQAAARSLYELFRTFTENDINDPAVTVTKTPGGETRAVFRQALDLSGRPLTLG